MAKIVKIQLPVDLSAEGFCTHLAGNLTQSEKRAMARLLAGLQEAKACQPNGRPVRRAFDVIRYILALVNEVTGDGVEQQQ